MYIVLNNLQIVFIKVHLKKLYRYAINGVIEFSFNFIIKRYIQREQNLKALYTFAKFNNI